MIMPCSFGMMTMECLLEFLLATLMILHLLEAKPFTLLFNIEEIKKTFKIKQHENSSFRYVGLGINQTKDGILVDQIEYIHQMKLIQIHKSRAFRKNDELTKEEKSQLRSFCGQMQWATSQTHLDLGFETCVMSNVGKHITVKDVDEANKAFRKFQSKTVHLKFLNLGNPFKVQAIAYSDAMYATLPDGYSQGALIVFLPGENGCVAPISWQSKKLNCVTKCPLASEALALSEAAGAGFLMASIW